MLELEEVLPPTTAISPDLKVNPYATRPLTEEVGKPTKFMTLIELGEYSTEDLNDNLKLGVIRAKEQERLKEYSSGSDGMAYAKSIESEGRTPTIYFGSDKLSASYANHSYRQAGSAASGFTITSKTPSQTLYAGKILELHQGIYNKSLNAHDRVAKALHVLESTRVNGAPLQKVGGSIIEFSQDEAGTTTAHVGTYGFSKVFIWRSAAKSPLIHVDTNPETNGSKDRVLDLKMEPGDVLVSLTGDTAIDMRDEILNGVLKKGGDIRSLSTELKVALIATHSIKPEIGAIELFSMESPTVSPPPPPAVRLGRKHY